MKKIGIIAGVTFLGLFTLANLNHWSLNQPMREVIADDARNEGVSAWGYHRYLLNPQVATFDLREIADTNSRIDVTRILFQYAEALKDRRFDHVILAYRGEARFMIDGDYFQRIGRDYSIQNVNYMLRTLPENILTLDGEPAYSEWRGGLIGVMNRQLQDLNRFHDDWYLDDRIAL